MYNDGYNNPLLDIGLSPKMKIIFDRQAGEHSRVIRILLFFGVSSPYTVNIVKI